MIPYRRSRLRERHSQGDVVDREQAAFLRAIAAAPDDDTARLAFADFLDERTPGRGELVRLDLHLASLSAYDPAREPLLARRAELISSHAESWLAELPAFPGVAYEPVFDRGLPGAVTADFDALRACGDDLFAAVPIRCAWLGLPDRNSDLAALAALGPESWLGRVREINTGATNGGAAALAASPALANLVALRLRTWMGLDSTGVRPLAESPHLGRLEELELSGHDVGNEEAELVAGSRTLTRLASYTSRGVGMSAAAVVNPSGVAAFADAPVVRLRTLRLPSHSCESEATAALARGPATAGLEALDLSDNGGVGDAGAAALLRSSRLTGLRELNLRSTCLKDRGVRALADSPLVRGVRHLDVTDNLFTDEGATALALSEHLPTDCRVVVGWHPEFRRVTEWGLGALRERFPRLEVGERPTDARTA